MALGTLIAAFSALLRHGPAIVKAVRGVVSLVKQIRKDINPDTVLRSSVTDQIAHVNVFIELIARQSGQTFTPPPVRNVADYPAWQKATTEYLHEFNTNVFQPQFVDNMARLTLLYPPSNPGDAKTISDVIGFSDAYIRSKIISETDPAVKAQAELAYNSVLAFLNTYGSAFTDWEGSFDQTAGGLSDTIEEYESSVSDDYYVKENYDVMIKSAITAFYRASPHQCISNTGNLFLPNPLRFTQYASDDIYIENELTMFRENGSIVVGVTGNWDGVGAGIVDKNTELVAPNGLNVLTFNPSNGIYFGASPFQISGLSHETLWSRFRDMSADPVAAAAMIPSYHLCLNRYDVNPKDPYASLQSKPVYYEDIPKPDLYAWRSTIRTNMNADGATMHVFSRCKDPTIPYTDPVKWIVRDHGSFTSNAIDAYTDYANKVVDFEYVYENFHPSWKGVKPTIYVFCVITNSTAGVPKSLTSPANFRQFAINVDPVEVSAVVKPKPVPATALSYRMYNSGYEEEITSGESTFFDFLGSLIVPTGDDPNFSVNAIWLQRLAINGVDLNYCLRWIAEVGTRLGINVNSKYTALGTELTHLANTQTWLINTGPFAQNGIPLSLSAKKRILHYLYCDMTCAKAYLSQSSVAEESVALVRGDDD